MSIWHAAYEGACLLVSGLQLSMFPYDLCGFRVYVWHWVAGARRDLQCLRPLCGFGLFLIFFLNVPFPFLFVFSFPLFFLSYSVFHAFALAFDFHKFPWVVDRKGRRASLVAERVAVYERLDEARSAVCIPFRVAFCGAAVASGRACGRRILGDLKMVLLLGKAPGP